MRNEIIYGFLLLIIVILIAVFSLLNQIPQILWGFLILFAILFLLELVMQHSNYLNELKKVHIIPKIFFGLVVTGIIYEFLFNSPFIINTGFYTILLLISVVIFWYLDKKEN